MTARERARDRSCRLRWPQALALPALVLALTISAVGRAQATRPTSSPDEPASGQLDAERAEQAERLFQRGTEGYEARRYEQSYSDLKQAFLLYPSYRTACGLGQIELHLERFRDAAEHLDFCLSRLPVQGDEAARQSIMRGLAEARRHVTVFAPQININGATVFVNGKAVGVTPLTADLFIEPGRRRVTVKKTGYGEKSGELFFPAGGTSQLRITLERVENSSPPATTDGGGSGLFLTVGAALSVATSGFGAVLLWTASDLNTEASQRRSQAAAAGGCAGPRSSAQVCTQAADATDRASARSALATTTLLAGAGAGVLTGVVYLWWRLAAEPPPTAAPAAFVLIPRVGAGEMTVSLGGRF